MEGEELLRAGWEMDGYALLKRGKTVRGGECGIIAENASYPVLDAAGGGRAA